MEPLASEMQMPPRVYTSVTTRPLIHSGFERFSNWIENERFSEIYNCTDVNQMADRFQRQILEKYHECFPTKTVKLSSEDKPWITKNVKELHRKMRREFYKNKRSEKWSKLKEEFSTLCRKEKENYYKKIVADLKISNPSQWYSKVKRMAGKATKSQEVCVEELIGLTNKEQAESIASHYSKISNQYDEVKEGDFAAYLYPSLEEGNTCPRVEPLKVHQTILKLNKRAATVPDDIPMKVIAEFSVEFAFPLAHIINSCIEQGVYPDLWKKEFVTPVPKVFPPEKLKDLRRISGLLNFAKVADKIIGEMMIEDMAHTRDKSQYGNEKKVSAQHYLIKLLHRIYSATDRASGLKAAAVIVSMVDWSQAFDRQCHKLGIESFIQNGVRRSLIPLLISFFQTRRMVVKWNGDQSSVYPLKGGGPQGDLMGILEYLSQTNHNTDFIAPEDKFKFIDDLSFIEIINLICIGLSNYDLKAHVASDVSIEKQFLPGKSTVSQFYLDKIAAWTKTAKMKLNTEKSKYMVFNFTRDH